MTNWLKIDDPEAPARAAEVIGRGGLVILPTDTVYGVAADWRQPDAVAALYDAKQRLPDKAIPILLADEMNIINVARDITGRVRLLAEAFWPGALTIVVPKHGEIPEIVSSLPTVGVRVPDHDGTREVIKACGGTLAVTSANVSGGSNTCTAQEALAALGEAVTLLLDGGRTPGGKPSTVVDAQTDGLTILRAGPVTAEEIRRVIEA